MLQRAGYHLFRTNEKRQDRLIQAARTSGHLTPGEVDEHLAVLDYRGLIESIGLLESMQPQVLLRLWFAARTIVTFRTWLDIVAYYAWRCGLIHVASFLSRLWLPVIFVSRFCQTLRCSRPWMVATYRSRRLVRSSLLIACNLCADIILCAGSNPMCVIWFTRVERVVGPLIRWFRNRCANAVFLLGQSFRYVFCCRLTVLAHCQTIHKMVCHHADFRRTSDLRCTLADSILGRLEAEPKPLLRSERWVDVTYYCPLFADGEDSWLTSLWKRIDDGNEMDQQSFDFVLKSFAACSGEEVVTAVRRIARPPRPVLSAVLVATGLRCNVAAELAKLPLPHLASEISRWQFFGGRARVMRPGRPTIVLVPVGQHHQLRIDVGKHYARVLELLLLDELTSYEFVFALPSAHSPQAPRRDEFASAFAQTLGCNFRPPNAKFTVLSDLATDVELPNTKGLPLILGLRRICAERPADHLLLLTELNDSASWLNVIHLARRLENESRGKGACMVSGARPIYAAGKDRDGHVATRLFNMVFRTLVPTVPVSDSSSVLKLATIADFSRIAAKLSCLDYAIDQEILGFMSLEGKIVEVPIQWYQALGPRGHVRSWHRVCSQLFSTWRLSSKIVRERRLRNLKKGEYLPVDAGFDFRVFVNSDQRVFKGYMRCDNRLALLLLTCFSFSRRYDQVGHQPYAGLVPLATRLIRLVGQGPLKSILYVCEGRFRDPLPSIREILKRDVEIIAPSRLEYDQQIRIPGTSEHFSYGLVQPFAGFGTLHDALQWNLAANHREGVDDTLQSIARMLDELHRSGVFDPDMKSLYDCGLFAMDDKVRLRYLDFAGFTSDPRVARHLALDAAARVESMKDYRRIAICLRRRAEHRELFFKLRREVLRFYQSIPTRTDWARNLNYTDQTPNLPAAQRTASVRGARLALVNQVISTARFGAHAPMCELADQLALQRLVPCTGGDVLPCIGKRTGYDLPQATTPRKIDVTFVAESLETCDQLVAAARQWLPEIRPHGHITDDARSFKLLSVLATRAGAENTHIVQPFGGDSSRMRQLIAGTCPHKALMPVLGRPLFIHGLAQMLQLAAFRPGIHWILNPDTIVFLQNKLDRLDRPIVVPLPATAIDLLRAARHKANGDSSRRPDELRKCLLRCALARRYGGYSFPSLFGVSSQFLVDLKDQNFGDRGTADFWEYVSSVVDIPGAHAKGQVATEMPDMWFDLDTPSRLKAFYDYVSMTRCSVASPAAWEMTGLACEGCTATEASVELDPDIEGRALFRRCVFDNATIRIHASGNCQRMLIDGLVVANSCVDIYVKSPVVRNVLIYGVENGAVALDLDCQVVAGGQNGRITATPLTLVDFRWRGQNELLRCTAELHDWGL